MENSVEVLGSSGTASVSATGDQFFRISIGTVPLATAKVVAGNSGPGASASAIAGNGPTTGRLWFAAFTAGPRPVTPLPTFTAYDASGHIIAQGPNHP